MGRLRTRAWLLGVGAVLLLGCEAPGKGVVYKAVSWKLLGNFPYRPSVTPRMKTSSKPSILPQAVRDLAGQPLRLTGYMMPVEMDGREVRSFVLVRDQQLCCFGRMPALNEWVLVRVGQGGGVDMNMDEPIEVEGSLEVGEDIEEGAVMSLYRMVADTVKLSEGKPKGWKAN
ncbi:DUF3299 domain-containing protein [bacterium]|nr:DUF3299 domain-containing protein [bacterium]